ncbi:ABC transporter substrate-binding protein [Amycolatopsis sp. NPDC059021]|uniref:peptide ABC transporter substrate-binding protein n=1 Tax=Amycolatopsis sp. NPDC059021 TaxID=3346704 RepID=UPI00366CC1D0
MRSRVLVVLFAVFGLVAAGCSESDTPAAPGVLSVGLHEPATLLPADVQEQSGRLVTSALWTPLADYDAASGKVTERAAESITSTDRKQWTVRLRPARFHDGSPVTAQSYVDTWRVVAGQPWAAAPILNRLLRATSITAPDDATIRIDLDRPAGQVPVWLSAPGLAPLPRSVLGSRDWNAFARAPIGNGPFRLEGPWRPGSGGKLVRVADAPGKAREIDLRVGEPAAHYDAVKAGKLDLAAEVPGDRHESMHHDFADRHLSWPLPEAGYLTFPMADKRFSDPTVRHAFAFGVDRAALEAGPLQHQVDPAKALLPPSDAPGERSGICRACAFDAAAGKALLAQASFTGPVTVYSGPRSENWTKPLADGLATALGVQTTSKPLPATGSPDGPATLLVKLGTASPGELLSGLAEAAGYTDDGFKQNLADAEAAATPQEAGELYRLVENQLLRDLPVAPLWTTHGHAVWDGRTHDVKATPFAGVDLAAIAM